MPIVYLVVEYGGEYEDKWSTNVKAYYERAKAEQFIIDWKIEQESLERKAETLMSFRQQYVTDNPKYIGYEHLEEIPRWKPGIAQTEITFEMRAERDEIKARNVERDKRNTEREDSWNAKYLIAANELRTTIDVPLLTTVHEESFHRMYSDSSMTIEELELE